MTPIDRRTVLRRAAAWTLAPTWIMTAGARPPRVDDPYADGRLVYGEPPAPAAGSFTVAVLPDTQFYSDMFPDQYLAQTRWIAERQAERNIVCVLHLGDITHRNTPAEWRNAARAMKQLDGRLPFVLTTGNHDYSEGDECKDRRTRLNEYFPAGQLRGTPTFGGHYDREPARMENSYHLFSAGGRDFLVLALEFGPRADVVRWANEVVVRYPKREAVLVTHAFVYHDDTRYDWAKKGPKQSWNPHSYPLAEATDHDVCDGQELWDRLVSRHPNFVLTLNGHTLGDGLGRTVTATADGRAVPQVLVNFQMRPNGGDGWLRLLEFRADGRTVEVVDYSPTRNQRNESPQNRFTMTLAPVKG
jgi:Calcineurin-like phosphoesterase